jgi:pimeloyl-ACP methyl ester carboxylesterase
VAGTLELTDLGTWDVTGNGPLRFDPTLMTDGIELPEDDSLMELRRHVYAMSARRRMNSSGPKRGERAGGAVYMTRRTGPDPNRKVHVNGVEICYDRSTVQGRPLLLIMGFACGMTWWHPRFIEMLERKGFHVIRFDNRDSGRSSRIDKRVGKVGAMFRPHKVAPYTVETMADDAAGLLEALDVPKAHVMGISLGGMIAQALTIKHPQRVLSLTSINSNPRTAKRPASRWPTVPVLWHLLKPQRSGSEEKWVKGSMPLWRRLNASHFPFDEEHVRGLLHLAWSWGGGVDRQADMRQMVAVLAAADRTAGLKKLRKPALVVHGTDDPLIRLPGGKDTFEAIEGAKLLLIDGMGHYTPMKTWGVIVDAVADIAADADRRTVETVFI